MKFTRALFYVSEMAESVIQSESCFIDKQADFRLS